MESYYGRVRTCADAILLFQASQDGTLPRLQRRLSEKERQSIRSGSVFIWDEREAGMRRWTDGRPWSSSRVAGRFLTYREMERDVHGRDPVQKGDFRDDRTNLRYKPTGLTKQSFSITASTGHRLHLISYHSESNPFFSELQIPTIDPGLRDTLPQKSFFPPTLVNDLQNFAVFAREQAVATNLTKGDLTERHPIPPATRASNPHIPLSPISLAAKPAFHETTPLSPVLVALEHPQHGYHQLPCPHTATPISSKCEEDDISSNTPWPGSGFIRLPSLTHLSQSSSQCESPLSKNIPRYDRPENTIPSYTKFPALSHILSQ